MSSNIKVQRICHHCGNQFIARTTVTQYCSGGCSKRAYKARIRAKKVEASNNETERIKTKPIEDLKAKAFLSITETCKLVGISRRTVYRMMERGELITGKAGKRTIVRRSDLEQLLFANPTQVKIQPDNQRHQEPFELAECYNLTEIQNRYSISGAALDKLLKRNSINKIKKGWFSYVPKTAIDKLLA